MRKIGIPLCSLAVLLAVGLSPQAARADGLVLTSKQVSRPSRTSVRVEVVEEVATTSTELEFPCCTGGDRRFLFPVPEAASVVGFSVFRNGEWEAAEMTKNKASTASDVSTSSGGSLMTPELQTYLGQNSFIISLSDNDDTQPVRVKLNYIEILPYEFGEVSFVYPLKDYEGTVGGPRESFSLAMNVTSVRPISGYQATNYASLGTVLEQSDGRLAIQYEAQSFLPTSDFPFSYAVVQDSPLYVNLLAHHEACGEDGFFLLVVEPKQEMDESQAIPKYFSFVMDIPCAGEVSGFVGPVGEGMM